MIGLGLDGQAHNQGNGADPTFPFPIGVYIQDASSNTIGGTGDGEGNTISGNSVGVYIFGKSGSSSGNQMLGNSFGSSLGSGPAPGNAFYGVLLSNAPANNAPGSGAGANRFQRSGIADFREYSGPVGTSTSSGSARRAQKATAHKSRGVHSSPSKKARQHPAIIHSHVPAGPMRMARPHAATH